MYSVMSDEHVRIDDGKSMLLVTIICDKEADIPEPKDNWSPGSICMIAEGHKFRVLNNEGEWV